MTGNSCKKFEDSHCSVIYALNLRKTDGLPDFQEYQIMQNKRTLLLLLTILLLAINAQRILSTNKYLGKDGHSHPENDVEKSVVETVEEIMSKYQSNVGDLKTKITELVNQTKKFSLKIQRFETEIAEIQRVMNTTKNENGLSKDCLSILRSKESSKGNDNVYIIYPDLENPKIVFCDMTTDGGGWTVMQKRQDGSTDFNQTWNAYKNGFGNPRNEYWIGNDVLYKLTKNGDQQLRVDVEDFNGEKGFATYSMFSISNELQKYKLHIGGYNGSIGDSMRNTTLNPDFDLNGMVFATFDDDNGFKCASSNGTGGGSGWWYNECTQANLNAPYRQQPIYNKNGNIYWYTFKTYNTLKKVQMMIRQNT